VDKIIEVYEKYKHLDLVLSNPSNSMVRDFWVAIKNAAQPSVKSDGLPSGLSEKEIKSLAKLQAVTRGASRRR